MAFFSNPMAAGSSYHTGESGDRHVEMLLKKANSFRFEEVYFLYRNGNKEYFDEVKRNGNVMEQCKKDMVGHPESPINEKLDGIYFCATLFQEDLPTNSPYGDTRICIPLEALFKETSNLYFANFYCFGWKNHHVLLVLTQKGSDADAFCKKNLPMLNRQENMFLRRKEGKYYVAKQERLWVNVFYTESVNTDDLKKEFGEGKVYFKGGFGKAAKTNGSIKTNAYCTKYNLSSKERQELSEKNSKEESHLEGEEILTEQLKNM